MGTPSVVLCRKKTWTISPSEVHVLSQYIITIVFILICFGQVWALRKSRFKAVEYYFCVAPLSYFSIWSFGTWEPARVCGIILILGGLFKYHRPNHIPRFTRHPFFVLTTYVIGITIIGSFFWPIDAMGARSAAYGTLRVVIQILNWLIIVGVAWQIAIALSTPRNFEKIRRVVILVGVLHSLYAIYQIIAFYTGLPVTGIRRPYSSIGIDYNMIQFGLDKYAGTIIYRVNSFAGEPKHFGTISLIWISLVLTMFLEGTRTEGSIWKAILFFTVLSLTYSTTAITGATIAVILTILILQSYKKTRVNRFVMTSLIIVSGIILFDVVNPFDFGRGSIVQLFLENTIWSWLDVYKSGLVDLAELEAKKILSQQPVFVLTGTGLGGISLYIAQNMGGADIIFAPNNGLLSFICNIGIIGILCMIWCFYRHFCLAFASQQKVDPKVKSLAFVGLILFLQCFIFSAGLLPFAFGFLLAAKFMHYHKVPPQNINALGAI